MPLATAPARILLVLSPTPMRRLLGDWLRAEGYGVREAFAGDVAGIIAAGEADLVLTSSDLEGEWHWADDPRVEVLVLTQRRSAHGRSRG
jgi:DNA-binding response OmpR family regulator